MLVSLALLVVWGGAAESLGPVATLKPVLETPTQCLVLKHPLPQGGSVSVEDGDLGPCPKPYETRATVLDRDRRVLRTTRPLDAGIAVVISDPALLSFYSKGSVRYIQAWVGPVHVSRAVTVVESSSSKERVFVRTADGMIISVRATELELLP